MTANVNQRPQVGQWLTKLVKGGPEVAVAIEMRAVEHEPGEPDNDMRGSRSPTMVGIVEGKVVDPWAVWRMSLYGRAITRAEYEFRVASAEWAREHAPHEAIAKPRERIDLMRAAIPF